MNDDKTSEFDVQRKMHKPAGDRFYQREGCEMINPDDDEIMAVVRERPNLPTYAIKNHLRGQFRGLATSFILRRLKALEVAAKVCRTGASSNSITWKIMEPV